MALLAVRMVMKVSHAFYLFDNILDWDVKHHLMNGPITSQNKMAGVGCPVQYTRKDSGKPRELYLLDRRSVVYSSDRTRVLNN